MEQLTLSFKELAEIKYLNAKEQHDKEVAAAKTTYQEALHDLDYCVRLGFPAYLPEHTITILADAMALDKFAPKTPTLSQFYRLYNVDSPNG